MSSHGAVIFAILIVSLGCGGPQPPEDYPRSFRGDLLLDFDWEMAGAGSQTVPDAALNFRGTTMEEGEPLEYAVSTFPFICDLDLRREGQVGVDGNVDFNVVVPMEPCGYEDAAGDMIVVRPTIGSARWWPDAARLMFTADVELLRGSAQVDTGTLTVTIDGT